MSRRDFVLPREALDLVKQVKDLEERAARVRSELAADLAGIRQNAEREVEEARKLASEERRAAEVEIASARQAANRELDQAREQLSEQRWTAQRRIEEMHEEVEADRAQLNEARAQLQRDQDVLEALLQERVRGFGLISEAWADYEQASAETLALALEEKSRPAPFAAAGVRSIGQRAAALRRELKRAEWVLRLYEWHFPWLTELRDMEEESSFVGGDDEVVEATDDGQPPDPAQRWLSEEEFKALPEVERNQRALDRYLRSRKTPWQLGRDYERYIGYLREREGARVTYQGIFAGLEDLGRDLLAARDGSIEVIQCKRWARHKTIHEKHVFQLFGTVVAARIEYPEHEVTGTFATTTTLSERAHEFARQLEIRVQEAFPLDDYPRIKCNVGRGGERIYHLPFDQQYDNTLITPERGETWVATTAEAEALGFRRAWRWRPAAAQAVGA